MRESLQTAILWLSAIFLVAFVVVVGNQTMQIVAAARAVGPTVGSVVLWTLLALYGVLLFVPVWLYLRLPGALKPPDADSGPTFERYLGALGRRLRKNPRLHGIPVGTAGEIEHALTILDEHSDRVIRDAARIVFLTTAVSQDGRLDAFLVLGAQARLVWRVAHTYYQRPSLRELVYLYTAVAATALVAGELEDLDIEEQIEPVIGSVLGASLAGIPGLQGLMSILMSATLTGAANAFLTLRVGNVTKRYCMGLRKQTKRDIRRAATRESAKALGPIVMSGTRTVASAVWNVSKDKTWSTFGNLKEYGKSFARRGRQSAEEQMSDGS